MKLRALNCFPGIVYGPYASNEEADEDTDLGEPSKFIGLTFFPVGSDDLQGCFDVFWRPKSYRLTVSLTRLGSPWVYNGAYDVDVRARKTHNPFSPDPIGDRNGAGDEKSLICPPYDTQMDVNGAIGETNPIEVKIGNRFVFLSGLPRVLVQLRLGDGVFSGVQSFKDNTPPETPNANVAFTAFGQTVQMFNWGAASTLAGSVALDVLSWWPFAHRDGSDPWWNAATGEPIGANPLR